MWNEEGGDGEHRVVPSEPDLVGSIPGQGVQVVHEHRLLQVLPHQLVKKMECLHVSRTDKASARHFKAVEGGLVGRDVSQKVRVFVCFFLVPCFDVAHAGHCKFVNVQCFSVFINNHYIRLQVCHIDCRRNSSSPWRFKAGQITVHFELRVHICNNEVHQVINMPCVN